MPKATATSFKGLRAQIEAELKPSLKGWAFYKSGESVDEDGSKPGLLLERDSFTKLHRAAIVHNLTLHFIAPQHTTEDQLDDWTDQLIEALDGSATFADWQTGTRSTWAGICPAYQITFTANTTREA